MLGNLGQRRVVLGDVPERVGTQQVERVAGVTVPRGLRSSVAVLDDGAQFSGALEQWRLVGAALVNEGMQDLLQRVDSRALAVRLRCTELSLRSRCGG
jgi:hypothetical protein